MVRKGGWSRHGILAVTFGESHHPMMGLQAGRGMEPENVKPDTGESKCGDPEVVERKIVAGEGPEPRAADAKAEAKASQPKPVQARMTERKFSQVSRRELLKVAPVLALGAFAIPRLQ